MNSAAADAQRIRKEDVVIGGFTLVRDKQRYTKPQLLNSSSVHVIRAVVILPVRDLAKQAEETFKRLIASTSLRIIDEADRVITEEKQDWYNVFEGALYGAMHLSSSKDLAIQDLVRSHLLPTIDSQCTMASCTLQKVSADLNFWQFTSQAHSNEVVPYAVAPKYSSLVHFQILLSATLTHDPGPLKRFRLNFPRLFLATSLFEDVSSQTCLAPSDEPSKVTTEEDRMVNKYTLRFDAYPLPDHRNVKPPISVGGASTGGVGVFSIPSGLKEFVVEITDHHKPPFLAYLVRKLGHEKVLCFTNSRESTKRLAFLMSKFNGLQARALYAGLPLPKRSRILKEFGSGGVQVRHFKMRLRAVGMGKVKNFPFHASKLRPYEQDYQNALSELKKSFQVSCALPSPYIHLRHFQYRLVLVYAGLLARNCRTSKVGGAAASDLNE
ncbi:unnamed protein product [Schistocephalus solidus]|uniref:ATP-dependent RNA helicase n=1 Tax=Schistocephalus solidus TaxID=70667 RepID=A0A183T0Q5_SCHSO|nr:unnamed protein product [Schistocephalus solidus]